MLIDLYRNYARNSAKHFRRFAEYMWKQMGAIVWTMTAYLAEDGFLHIEEWDNNDLIEGEHAAKFSGEYPEHVKAIRDQWSFFARRRFFKDNTDELQPVQDRIRSRTKRPLPFLQISPEGYPLLPKPSSDNETLDSQKQLIRAFLKYHYCK